MLTEQWMALNKGKVWDFLAAIHYFIVIKDIEVPDLDSDSFEKFLSYIYKRTLDLDELTVAEMLGILSAGFIYKIDKFYLFEQKSNSF
jgi:hypothetical protein